MAIRFGVFASVFSSFFFLLPSTAHASTTGSWSGTVAYIDQRHIGVKSQAQTRDFLIPADFNNVRSSSETKTSSLGGIKPGTFVTVRFAQRTLFGSTTVSEIVVHSPLGMHAPMTDRVGHAVASAPQSTDAKITLYTNDGFNGPSIQLGVAANDLHDMGFAKKTDSFVVASRTWRLCDEPNFAGRCITAGPGRYSHDYAGNFASSIVSLRPVHSGSGGTTGGH